MRSLIGFFIAVGVLVSGLAQAGVVVDASRVVFSSASREQSLLIANDSRYPVIIQTWIDDGSPEGTPETAGDVPVLPLPGIFRLEPDEQKNLRLLATQIEQPQDRESLYWLNIYEIPPMDTKLSPDQSAIRVAVRLQLKVFYRPQHLQPDVSRLTELQQFSLSRTSGSLTLTVNNTSPYYATFSAASLTDGTHTQEVAIGMLAPFSHQTLEVKQISWQPSSIHYTLINDQGNEVTAKQELKP